MMAVFQQLSFLLFRCKIPVVLMGETGCGKTRLIRYMCDIIAQGVHKDNLLILKVIFIKTQL